MFQSLYQQLCNNNGKAKRPNLAVVCLIIIIAIQALFLWRAYGPKHTAINKQTVIIKSSPTTKPLKPTALPKGTTPMPPIGKIAIIIDDSGYSRKDCDHLASIDVPVTISILPQLPYSTTVDQCASEQGKGIMLHLPLEPHVMREKYPETYFIKTNMSSRGIIDRFRKAISTVPHAGGINNHEGSKATEDTHVMSVLFKELAKQNLFFVDSRVTNKSVCQALAEKIDLPFTGRDVFLDNSSDRVYIEGQFRILANKARQNGTAVAIGHAREKSWVVMTEQIKKLKAQGFEFVTVPQIIAEQGH